MAAPTVTWYPVTDNSGSPQKGSAITVLDFGNVQAGYWSDVKAIVATFTGNSANTLKFWLNDTSATGGNTNVSQSAPSPWKHQISIDDDWWDPDDPQITDSVKAGTSSNPLGEDFQAIDESEPSSSNFITTSVNDGDDTDYIYLCLQPPSDSGDGITENWGYRISYLFP